MKKIFIPSPNGSTLLSLFSLTAIVFLVQSCCFLGPLGIASSKPCNCKPGNRAYVSGNAASPVTTSHGHTISLNTERLATISGNSLSTLPEPTGPAVPEVVFVAGNPDADIQTLPNAILAEGEQTIIRQSKASVKQTAKKLPLGIKAIRTHITAGPNISFKSSKEDYGNTNHKHKPGIGFQFGFGTAYSFSDRFAVTPSLLLKHNSASEVLSYSTPGETGGGTSQEYESKYSYTYLSVPIMAEIKVNEQLTVMAGPEVNLLLGAKVKSSGAGSNEKTDIKSSSVSTGVGIQAGLKYDIPNSPIGIQLIYDHRISRLNKKTSEYYPGGGGYDNPAWNMKSIQLGVTCAICQFLKT